jgi:hypothetical protein
MAKKQIKNYVFEPGIGKDDGLYPFAAQLLLLNKNHLQNQVVAFINYSISVGTITTTAAVGNGTTATLNFSTKTYPPYIVGQTITVSGVSPAGYNGTKTVTACTTTSVSFASTQTGSQSVAGSITSAYTGYTYASQKCTRDVGFFIDAVVHDVKYGGNVKSRQVADYFWIDGEPQIRGDVTPEITGQAYLRDIINDYIFENVQNPVTYGNTTPQVIDTDIISESDAASQNTTLWNIFRSVIANGISAMPAKVPGVSSIRLMGQYDVSDILLITDTDNGIVLYNFADPANSVSISYKQGRSSGDGNLLSDVDFKTWSQKTDTITTINLSADTSTLTSTASIQIFIEVESQSIRPWEFGTDAIERMRVAAPQAMLDADFEYGLQPTKWQALGMIRMYPSTYEIPGSDLSVISVTTDASVNTSSFGSSLITVTTNGTHGFTAGTPITVKGLASTVSGFARAEGSFLVYNTPSAVSFTYYASARVGTSNGQSLFTSFVQIRQAGFFTGAAIGQPSFSLFSNGTSISIQLVLTAAPGATSLVYTGTTPTVGSPVTGSASLAAGTSVSGAIGSGTVSATVLNNALSGDTTIDVVSLTGIQPGMAINSSGSSNTITTIVGNTLNMSSALGTAYKGRDDTNLSVSGTLIAPAGTSASFDVGRSGGTYTVTLAGGGGGTDYFQGDKIKIVGTDLGGASPANDITILINSVSGSAISTFTATGTSITGGATYTGVLQTGTTGGGSGFSLNVVRQGGTGAYTSILKNAIGSSYIPTEQVTFAGTSFGGASPANDIVVDIQTVDLGGEVLTFTISGTPVGATGDATYNGVSTSNIAHAGAGATFDVTRTNGIYSFVTNISGSNYEQGNRITVNGTSLDGATVTNDAVITVTSISGSGAITAGTVAGTPISGDTLTIYSTLGLSDALIGSIPALTFLNAGSIATFQVDFASNHGLMPGTTILTQVTSQPAPTLASTNRTITGSGNWDVKGYNGVFVAVRASATATQRSTTGQTWSAGGALPSSAAWSAINAGTVGSTDTFVAISTSGSTDAAYSTNGGVTWTSATLPTPANWIDVTFGNGVFVAIATGGTATAYSTDGITWVAGGALPSSTTWTKISSGLVGTSTYFVAIASGGTVNAYSADNGLSWIAGGALPGSVSWSGIAYGNNRFFAVASGSTTAAISTSGVTWTSITLPSGDNWCDVEYGDDVFLVVADGSTNALTSFTAETGSFTTRTLAASASYRDLTYTYYVGQGFGRFVLVDNSTNALEINLTSANHQLGTGPHVISAVPSPSSIRFTARTTGTVDASTSSITGVVYARPDSFFVHRPFDGGVQLGTGNPSHGAQAIRQSKKYIRYQSGKGIMYTTGGLFAPSYNLASATATATTINSIITFTTDDTDHGLQAGAVVEIIGCVSFEYNGEYTVETIVDARSFRVRNAVVLTTLSAELGNDCKVIIKRWHGSTVRIGAFDEQNGLFYQYDGQEMAVVRRSSTNQLAGTAAVNTDSNLIVGTGTRFLDQLKVGDKIVIRGMSHIVTGLNSQTSMTIAPDWRGATNITGARICVTEELYIPQRYWNLDTLDGDGPSGYDILPWRMQMLGMQYSWYAAGFVEWMLRGADGRFVFLHKIRNSNVNTEAYMRTANLPVRYEVENRSAISKLSAAMDSSQTTIPLSDASRFPTNGTVYIDNEIITYNGKSGDTLTDCTRAATYGAFTAGTNRLFTGSSASTHSINAGVVLMSCTATPTISHWGSALLTDGMFDEDRGYIFNYASTGLSITTGKQTAFMIRLAPSVSNALVGDLGERDLLNRAQLLLNEIAITTDTGTGTVVIEGILNPKNYPTNPASITWTTLNSAAAGGQPSFAQIALGGSINWGSGAFTTTATIQGALTATILARGFTTVSQSITALATPSGIAGRTRAFLNTSNDFYITNAQYDSLTSTPLRVGDRIVVATYVTSSQTISTITRDYLGTGNTRIVMSANANVASPLSTNISTTIQNSISLGYASAYQSGRTDFLVTNADNTSVNLTVGDILNVSSFVTGSQTISSITTSYATVSGVAYTRIVMSAGANATQAVNTNTSTTVTAAGTAANYAGNFLFFTQATWNNAGATVGTRVATSFTQFPAGSAVSAVTTRRLSTTTIVRATFTQTLTASVAAAATVTFQFGAEQYAIPGEQVFSFLCQPGSLNSLSLEQLKELTTTAIGGRGTFPNGPDVLAINVYKVTGAAVTGSVILRWGEAQA